MSPGGVSENEVKINGSNIRSITIKPADTKKRIDVIVVVPERCKLKVETSEGAVELVGNFESVEARTETGTIVTDIPADDIKYQFVWTESRPRYLADFDIAELFEDVGAAAMDIDERGEDEDQGPVEVPEDREKEQE